MDNDLRNEEIEEMQDDDNELNDDLDEEFDESDGGSKVESSKNGGLFSSVRNYKPNTISPVINENMGKKKDDDSSKYINPFKNKLNDYANDKKKEGQEKLDQAKKMVDDGKKKEESLKKQGERINKLRDKLGDDPEKNKFAKSMLDKAAKSNATKQEKQAAENKSTAEKAEKLVKDGKKLVESGSKLAADIASGNVAGIAKDVFELAKNDLVKKLIKRRIKIALIGLAVWILLIMIFVSSLLEPITDAMEVIKNGANVSEKVHNFMYGLGYGDSVTVFYDELEFLETHYDRELDEALLMSTLFYDDVMGEDTTLDDETSLLEVAADDNIFLGWYNTLIAYASSVGQEALTEKGQDGIAYSTNKTFRLMQLSRAMMSKTGGSRSTVSLQEYLGLTAEQLSADRANLMQSFMAVLFYPLLSLIDGFTFISTPPMSYFMFNPIVAETVINPVMQPLVEKGYITSDMANMSLENFFSNLTFLLDDFFSMFSDIKGLEIVISNGEQEVSLSFPDENVVNLLTDLKTLKDNGITDFSISNLNNLIENGYNLVCGASETLRDFANFIFSISDINDITFEVNVTYEKYSVDLENYKEYLKTEYIPKMPEFKKYLVFDENNEPTEKSIDYLVNDIIILSEDWNSIYGEDNEGSSSSNDACIGDIKHDVLNQLSLPVSMDIGTVVNFTSRTAFGSNGSMHNGVDLNLESVGVDVGSPVFSIYDGEVIESSASGKYTKTINGGGVKIQYELTYEEKGTDVTSKFVAEYEGLDPTSVPLVGETVSKGQQIGVIGAAGFSEDGVNPGLHFAFYDVKLDKYLNPVNMFITCFTDDDDIPLVQTNELSVHELGISKTNFKTAVTRYISETNNNILKTWDLDLVYDVSRANNVNPELVVIRAIVEGFSPYSKGYQDKNNYWGIGCYNGASLSRCTSYSSFSEGIAGFANLSSVKNSETIVDMMMSYVNIGSYWWKPGDSGAGGCYYFEAEQKYMSKAEVTRVSQACLNPSYVCNENNKAGCLATNQEDQRAHAAYNCEAMNTLFQRIFANYHVASPIDRNLDDVDESLSALPGNACAEDDCIIDTDLETFLTARGSSVEKFNTEITRAKNQAGGSCTRNGAVAIAKKTLDYMKGKGAKLPYYWGGGWGDKISGAQAIWGAGSEAGCGKYGGNNGNIWYPQCGLDCAGFVRWVLNTDGYSLPAHEANNFGQGFLPGAVNVELANVQLLKAGDIMFSGGHVVFIVGVDKANSRYIIAEAGGKTVGVQYSTKSFNASGYTGVNMDGFYTAPQACLQ